MTTFTQLNTRLKNFLRGWLLVLGLKECLVERETLCVKSEVILLSFSNYTEKTFEIRLFSSLLYRGRKKAPSYIFPEFSSYCENFLIFCYFWIQGLPVFNCKFVICIMLWFLEFELFVYCFGEEIQIKMGHLVTLTKKNKYSGAHHYNPRLVYLLPPFWSPFLFYQLEGFFSENDVLMFG